MAVWYKRQRNIPERPWFKDGAVLQVFDYLEALAYVCDGRDRMGNIIRQGSCPTTRADIAEATGLSYKTVDRCLKKLIANNDIIVKGNSVGSVITICNYGGYGNGDSLFGTSDDTPNDTTNYTTNDTTVDTPHLSNTDNRYIDNLISPYSPYKKEREKGDLALEVKKRYNKAFDSKLPPCIRLTMPTRMMVEECLRRFGMQSVDLVFEQILQEPFSLGQNKTGFVASFQYIFEPRNFQQYLERAQLALKKKNAPAEQKPQQQPDSATVKSVGTIEDTVATPSVPERQNPDDYRREMRDYAKQHPDSVAASIVAQWDANNE